MSSGKKSVVSPDSNARFEFPSPSHLSVPSFRIFSAETIHQRDDDDCKSTDTTRIALPDDTGFITPPDYHKRKQVIYKREYCPWDCGSYVWTEQLEEHAKHCISRVMPCDYRIYGCQFYGNRCNRLIHTISQCQAKTYEDRYIEWFNQLRVMYPTSWTSLLSQHQTYIILNPFTQQRVQCRLKVNDGIIRVSYLHQHDQIPNLLQCVPIPLPTQAFAFTLP